MRMRCSRLWGPSGAYEQCKRPAAYKIVRGIWEGYYLCEQCREELDYPMDELDRLLSPEEIEQLMLAY
jgi:hypothetical protein